MVSQPPGITFLFLKRCTNRNLACKKAKPYGQDTELDLQDPSPFPRPGSPDHRSHLPLMPVTVGPSWKLSGPASPPWVCCVMSPPGQMGCMGEVQPPLKKPGLNCAVAKCTSADAPRHGAQPKGIPSVCFCPLPWPWLCLYFIAQEPAPGSRDAVGSQGSAIKIATGNRRDGAISRMINTISTCWSLRLNVSFKGMDFDVKSE